MTYTPPPPPAPPYRAPEALTAALPDWFTRRETWDLSPHYFNAYDVGDRHIWIAEVLEEAGWTVEWSTYTYADNALLDGKPHPAAGQTQRRAKCIPPNYDRRNDPAWHATVESIERSGNSDGAGRGAAPWVPGPVSPSTHHRDLSRTALRVARDDR